MFKEIRYLNVGDQLLSEDDRPTPIVEEVEVVYEDRRKLIARSKSGENDKKEMNLYERYDIGSLGYLKFGKAVSVDDSGELFIITCGDGEYLLDVREDLKWYEDIFHTKKAEATKIIPFDSDAYPLEGDFSEYFGEEPKFFWLYSTDNKRSGVMYRVHIEGQNRFGVGYEYYSKGIFWVDFEILKIRYVTHLSVGGECTEDFYYDHYADIWEIKTFSGEKKVLVIGGGKQVVV